MRYTQDVVWVISTSDLYLSDVLQNPHLRGKVCEYNLTAVDHVYSLLCNVYQTNVPRLLKCAWLYD